MSNNTPQIRFKGFTDAWTQRKLGEVADINPHSVLPDSFEYVDLESVVGISLISHRIENKETAPSRAQRLAKKNDIFYQTVRPYQKNNYLFDLPFENYVFSTGYAQLRPSINSYFLLCLLQEEKFVARVVENCTGTSYPAINSTVLSEMEVNITKEEYEQTAIGNFFRTLDDTITLHQRKLNELRELKRAYLQQMFPREGENVPRVRFAGFSGEWITQKAENIFISISNKNHPNLPVLSVSQEKGMVHRDEIGIEIKYDETSLKTYKRITKGQFAIHLRSFQGGFAHSTIEGITSPAYTILDFKDKDKHYSEYWKEIFTSSLFIKRLEAITYGIRDGRSISFSEFASLEFSVPCFEEQQQIGSFFRNLDEQITAQQTKLEQLKRLKSAYLQRMFV